MRLMRNHRRWRRFVTARLNPKAYLGLHVTVGLLVAVLGAVLFSAILEEVLDSASLVQWDVARSAAFHDRQTPAGVDIFYLITQLGSPVTVTAMGAVVVAMLWRRRRRTLILACVAAWGGEALLNQAIKHLVHRTRPPFGAAYLHGASFSFPSGHSMGATVAYGMVAYLLIRHVERRSLPPWLIVTGAATTIVLVSFSRLYLGVHYPSDVLGGIAVGVAWLAVCITGVEVAVRRATS